MMEMQQLAYVLFPFLVAMVFITGNYVFRILKAVERIRDLLFDISQILISIRDHTDTRNRRY